MKILFYLSTLLLLIPQFAIGSPNPDPGHIGSSLAAGIFNRAGKHAGKSIFINLFKKHPKPIIIERGPLQSNNCYDQTIKEPSQIDHDSYIETKQLVCVLKDAPDENAVDIENRSGLPKFIKPPYEKLGVYNISKEARSYNSACQTELGLLRGVIGLWMIWLLLKE